MDKETLIRNFSRYAYTYDKYAHVQRRAARELIGMMKEDGISNILEIGCGTGNYTLLLRERFRDARLKAIDISAKMLEVAEEKLKDETIEFVEADAETIDLEQEFDLISSNACFQWFEDLEKTIKKYKDVLKKNGIILFSTFGPATFCELNSILKCILKNSSVEANHFLTREKVADILRRNFKERQLREVIYEEFFPTLRDLLEKIRYNGVRGGGFSDRAFFTPRIFRQLEQAYLDKFSAVNNGEKRLRASYQIFYCRALK